MVHLSRTTLGVLVCTLATVPTATVGQEVTTVQLSRPIPIDGIFSAPDGTLLAAGSYAGTQVHRIDMMGNVSVVAENLAGPIHAVVNDRGDLYVSNFTNSGSVIRIGPDGSVHEIEVPQGPAGMVVGPDGYVYVAIYGQNAGTGQSIYRISPDDVAEEYVTGSGIQAPIGLAFDDDDVLHVVNARDGRIHSVGHDRSVTLFAELPKAQGYFSSGHLVFGHGRFYASGNASHVVYGIDRSGRVCTLFGSGSPGSRDGFGRDAQMTIPNGLALSRDGWELYVVAGGGGMNTEFRRVALPPLGEKPCGSGG